MEFRDLRYFILCAELGHVHLAAERAGRSQPALSKSIRRLEGELGTKLFERAGRGIRLTLAGDLLLVHARRLALGVAEASREITEAAKGSIGHIRLGSGPTTAEWLLPGIFKHVLGQSPRLTFEVTIGLAEELRRALREGRLDVVIGPLLGSDAKEFLATPLGYDTMVVAAREGHPLLCGRVSSKDLAAYGWLLPSTAMTSTFWLRKTLAARGVPNPLVQVEASSVMPLRRVIAQTDLLTFVSRRDLGASRDMQLHEVDIPELRHRRRFAVLCGRSGYIPVAAQGLIEIIREKAASILREGPT